MLFFFPLVLTLYWALDKRGIRAQNILLLVASYVFYGWWDYRFLSLIALSSVLDFTVGLRLGKTQNQKSRNILLGLSIAFNLGMLGFFKYANFFTQSFTDAFSLFGRSLDTWTLQIVLPVGISFYTFQTMSYTIDVYRRKMEPSKDWLAFMTFVSFFPQLVAGPIERASNLLPQFSRKREWTYARSVDGLRQIIWGLFKKMVIADNCAIFVNDIFANPADQSGATLLFGVMLFAFQIYGDFSGYSDIAIGAARMMGFDLMRNFAYPYFSRDIAEFWRRWHISLSTWFRDYLYIPLGGSRVSQTKVIRNVFIIFLVSGFWHGANWTFIVWGGLHALFFLPLLLGKMNRRYTGGIAENNLFPSLSEVFQMSLTFLLVSLAWVFFRADSIGSAMFYLSGIFDVSIFSLPAVPKMTLLLILLMVLIEWWGRAYQHPLEKLELRMPQAGRWMAYYAIIGAILLIPGEQQEFIYFQF